MTAVRYKSSEGYVAIVAPISSNPEQILQQPIEHPPARGPGDVAAFALGSGAFLRYQFLQKFQRRSPGDLRIT
jgi:hypothetical protein